MRTWTFLAALAFAAAIATAQTTAAAPQAQAAQAQAGNADTGKTLYSSYGCYACHGLEGQGGAAGPRIAPRPFPLAGFITFIRRPPNQMPLYTERIVSDEDLGHIHAFLEAIPAPRPVESIPLLQE
jgi:mono/diheme cytochrome c family protein